MVDPLSGFAERVAQHTARTGRPLVTLTYAQSLDGSIAARRDQRLDLSGEESRAMTHRLRAAHSAIAVGIGTLLADDPRLTARLAGGPDPQPIILDSQLRFPSNARLLKSPHLKPWVITTGGAAAVHGAELERAGARVIVVPSATDGRLDLVAVVSILGQNGITSLMIEGGARIITSFLAARLADWLVITIAPVFVGGLRAVEDAAEGPSSFPRLEDVQSTQLGCDVILWGDLKSEAR